MDERPIGVVHVLVDPLAIDDIGMRRPRNEVQDPIIDECPIFVSHGRMPLRVNQSTAIVGG